jgi:hypothetical protein
MNKLFDLVTSQISSFNQSIGPNHEVALLFPGMGNRYFFPSTAEQGRIEFVRCLQSARCGSQSGRQGDARQHGAGRG